MTTEEKRVQNNFRSATNAQFKAAEMLQNAEANKKLMEPDHLAYLHNEFDKSIRHLKLAKHQQKEIKSLVEKATKTNSNLLKIKENTVTRTRTAYTIYLAEYHSYKEVQYTPVVDKKVPAETRTTPKTTKTTSTPSAPATREIPYDPSMMNKLPVSRTPKPYYSKPVECIFQTDTTDASSGRRRIELEPALIFTHTDVDLRPYFKDKDLITCRGRISKLGPYIYFTVDFQIASSHSQSNFGSLQSGSLMRFKLMDGEYVSLYNLKSDRGHLDPYSGHTIFSGQYALGKEEIKKLSSSELDKMRVLWGTGYEDYDVYFVDYFINQINCLMSKK